MTETDHLFRQYFSDPSRFADVFNAFVFDPAEKISPDCLTEKDSDALLGGPANPVFPGVDPGRLLLHRAEWEGRRLDLCLYVLGEDDLDPALPVTVMTIETLLYQSQLSAWRADTKDLALVPGIVLVLYPGTKPQNTAKKLSELCAPAEKEWLGKTRKDFNVRLVTPFEARRKEIHALNTDVREILLAAKYAGEKKKIAAFISKNRDRIAGMGEDAKALFQALMGMPAEEESPAEAEEIKNRM